MDLFLFRCTWSCSATWSGGWNEYNLKRWGVVENLVGGGSNGRCVEKRTHCCGVHCFERDLGRAVTAKFGRRLYAAEGLWWGLSAGTG